MAQHFTRLLEGIAEQPERRVSELPLLGDDERRQLVLERNDTAAEFPREVCIHELFEGQAQKTPEAMAVEFGNERAELSASSTSAAISSRITCRRWAWGPKCASASASSGRLEMVVGLLGILKAGGAYVPLDPSYPAERLAFMIEDAQIAVLLDKEQLEAGRRWRSTRRRRRSRE